MGPSSLDTSPAVQRKHGSASKSPQTKRAAPQPPAQMEVSDAGGEKTSEAKKATPATSTGVENIGSLCLEEKKAASVEEVEQESPGLVTTVPKTIGAELIELIRRNTNLSYELSRVAIGVVIGHIQTSVPALNSIMEQILISLVESKVGDMFLFASVEYMLRQQSPTFPAFWTGGRGNGSKQTTGKQADMQLHLHKRRAHIPTTRTNGALRTCTLCCLHKWNCAHTCACLLLPRPSSKRATAQYWARVWGPLC